MNFRRLEITSHPFAVFLDSDTFLGAQSSLIPISKNCFWNPFVKGIIPFGDLRVFLYLPFVECFLNDESRAKDSLQKGRDQNLEKYEM